MAIRLFGVMLANDKLVQYSLRSIFGIGLVRSAKVVNQAKIEPTKRTKDLTDSEVARLRKVIEDLGVPLENDLRRQIQSNISRLQSIGAYRGLRHSRKLPVRGQRTRTNARTKRGKRVTVGSGKRSIELK